LIYGSTDEICNIAGGLPRVVKAILISETMRMETSSYREATGLWEPLQGRIIIKRSQLRSLKDYASTLLHEYVHAKTGTIDVSRQFEDELTSLLGIISAKTLQKNEEKQRNGFFNRRLNNRG
jgi:hypothetical protein